MPKKLTKAQVKKTMMAISKAIGRLMVDRAMHPTSLVPITVNGLVDVDKKFRLAFNRIK